MIKFMSRFFASIGFIVIILIIGIVIAAKYPTIRAKPIAENSILQINFDHPIKEVSSDSLSGLFLKKSLALGDIIRTIDNARKDPKIIGIVAKLNNVEIGLAQAQEIRNAIIKFRASRTTAPAITIAYADTFGELSAGTAAYYLASAFEEVWMQPMGTLGFTGIAMEIPFAKEALDKWQLKPRIGKRKEYKTFMDSLTEPDFTAANRESITTVLQSLVGQIIHGVATTRQLNDAEVQDAMNHSPLTDKEALKLGLVDKISHFDGVWKHLNNKLGKTVSPVSFHTYKQSITKLPHKSGSPKIALIYGVGNIYRDGETPSGSISDGMGSHDISKAFEEASKDPDVKAIIFRINSGGGSPVASETIRYAIETAKKAGKKVIVSMSDLAGSGGYWIAVNADKIVANPATITGSIGVVGGKIFTGDFWKSFGINWQEIHIGNNATMYLNTKDYSEQGWSRLQKDLDNIYDSFITIVSQGRKLSKTHVEEIAKGRIWTGPDALKYGLVDKLGDMSDAIHLAKSMIGMTKEYVFIDVIPKRKSLMEKIIESTVDSDESAEIRIPFINTIVELERFYISIVSSINAVTTPISRPKG